LATAVVVVALAGCSADDGGEQSGSDPASQGVSPLGHIHGLGVNPADDSLFVATHLGVYRVANGTAERIADRTQDTMAFTVVGPDHFLASGHPDLREDLPAHLGLIESTDAAGKWQSLSLLGEADFHALEVTGDRVYGYDGLSGTLMLSTDRSTWDTRAAAEILDLAANPDDPDLLLATTPAADLLVSRDGGLTFGPSSDGPDLVMLDWADAEQLVGLGADGTVQVSTDDGATWDLRGQVPGQAQALDATREKWHVATTAGIFLSTDAGTTWEPVPLGT
jgi:hypothetical protein